MLMKPEMYGMTGETMDEMMQMLKDTAYIRISGTEGELKAANYLKDCCAKYGMEAQLEAFPVEMGEIEEAELIVDGESIPCKGYRCAGSGEVEAPFYYMPNIDEYSLSQAKGRIVMVDSGMGYWLYQDLLKYGAVGFITFDGNALYADEDMDLKELRSHVSKGNKMPAVNINAKAAIRLVDKNASMAKIVLKQKEYQGESHNVVLELPGESDEIILLSAHYDSTPLSVGTYDNMSGSVAIFAVAKYFATHPHHYTLRFVWCGSEERGLLGSKAYAATHEAELEKIRLNINLDMVGCIMGRFAACCTAEERLASYISYMAAEVGFGIAAKQGVYPSDSTSFADKGIPAVTFARQAGPNTATIHNRYDTIALMKAEHMAKDAAFVAAFTERMACACQIPVAKEIPDNIKDKLEIYLSRKKGVLHDN